MTRLTDQQMPVQKYVQSGKYAVGCEDKPGHRIPKAGVGCAVSEATV